MNFADEPHIALLTNAIRFLNRMILLHLPTILMLIRILLHRLLRHPPIHRRRLLDLLHTLPRLRQLRILLLNGLELTIAKN